MQASAYNQSFICYSSETPYEASSVAGRAASVDFTAQNSTITLAYKQLPLVVPENLLPQQYSALTAKNCNVYVSLDNNSNVFQTGKLSSGSWIDQTWGLDCFQNTIQTAIYNVLYTTPTKIPQTDAGMTSLLAACTQVCEQFVYNGFVAPGQWNSTPPFPGLASGQYLQLGYQIYAPSVNSQSQLARVSRVAPTIQIALKLAGAIQYAVINVLVNQ
jgi:hypothetical protein